MKGRYAQFDGAQIFRAGLSGAVGTFAHYALFGFLLQVMLWDAFSSSTSGFLLGMLVNFILSRDYVFRSHQPSQQSFWRFCLTSFAGLLVNGFIVRSGTHLFEINAWACQVGATAIVFFQSFLINKHWTFRTKTIVVTDKADGIK